MQQKLAAAVESDAKGIRVGGVDMKCPPAGHVWLGPHAEGHILVMVIDDSNRVVGSHEVRPTKKS